MSHDSRRQITLTGILRKLIERVTSVRLTVYLTRCDLLHPNSMAGLKGKSAMDAVVTAQWDKKLPTYACFMDIKGCFPNIRHDIVRRLREYYLVDEDILALIADLLCNCWTTTVVNKSRSKWMVSRVGLGQGRTSSPLLNLVCRRNPSSISFSPHT